MLTWVLSKIICDTYQKEFRGQNKEFMQISFNLPLDYSKEEGYRWVELALIFSGYVGVFYRECSTLVPIEGLDGDGLLPGYDYTDSTGEWKNLSYHDSCWRSDGVESFIRLYKDKISNIRTFSNWYERIAITPEIAEIFYTAINKDKM